MIARVEKRFTKFHPEIIQTLGPGPEPGSVWCWRIFPPVEEPGWPRRYVIYDFNFTLLSPIEQLAWASSQEQQDDATC